MRKKVDEWAALPLFLPFPSPLFPLPSIVYVRYWYLLGTYLKDEGTMVEVFIRDRHLRQQLSSTELPRQSFYTPASLFSFLMVREEEEVQERKEGGNELPLGAPAFFPCQLGRQPDGEVGRVHSGYCAAYGQRGPKSMTKWRFVHS